MTPAAWNAPTDLPHRDGPRPSIHLGPPQHQTDQLPSREKWEELRTLVSTWGDADVAPSLRAAPGTVGLFLPENAERSASDECFLIGREFAHHHPDTDGGLHLVLPSDWHEAALARGWAVPHTWAGKPTVSQWTVLVFAPRSPEELAVVRRLVEVAEKFARGRSI